MKKIYFLISFISIGFGAYSQVGINTTTPSAQLEIKSSNQATPANTDGILIPKIDAFPVINPTIDQDGMMVYLTQKVGLNQVGFYYWQNGTTSWKSVTGISIESDPQVSTTTTNTIPKYNGTTLVDGVMIDDGTNVGVGTTPTVGNKLEIAGKTKTTNLQITNGATANFVLQSDATGNATWVNPNSLTTSEWYKESTTLPPTAITDDMYHTGNIAIGKTTADAPLDIFNFNNNFGIFLNSQYSANGNKAGIYNALTSNTASVDLVGITTQLFGTSPSDQLANYCGIYNSGNGIHYGNRNLLNGDGSGTHYANYSDLGGTGTGQQFGNRTNIYNSNNNYHYANYNDLNGGGSGTHYANYSVLGGTGTGNQSANYSSIYNSGNAGHYANENYLSGSGSGAHYANFSILSGSGSGDQFGSRTTISNTSNSNHYANFNNLSGSGFGTHFANYSELSGIGTGEQTINFNYISNSGNNSHFANSNRLNGTGSGIHYANFSQLTGSGTGQQIANNSEIYNSGNAIHFANKNYLNGTGSGTHYANYSDLEGAGTGEQFGNRTTISNTANNNHYANYNDLNGSGSGTHYANFTNLSGTGSGPQYANYSTNSNSGNNSHYGNFNELTGSGWGFHYGNFSIISGTGTGNQYNNFNVNFNSGNGTHFGALYNLQGTGTGTKYGNYTIIDPLAGGTHFGLFVEVLKTGSYAGYFLGNVAVGTTASNYYILPTTRGTVNQIIQTDATGNTSWVDATALTITESDPQVSSATANTIPKYNGTTLVDGVMIDNGTNVGVGISPTAGNKLEVAGKTKTTTFQMTTGATSSFVLQSDAAGNATWVNPTSLTIPENDPQVSSATTNKIPKYNGTTLVDGILLDNGTNVGVGTNNPSAKLEVTSTGTSEVRISSTSAFGPSRLSMYSDKDIPNEWRPAYIESADNGTFTGRLDFYTNGTGAGNKFGSVRAMSVSNGNVGIGITNPSEKLEVAGKTKTTTFQMTTGATSSFVLQSDGTGNGTWVAPSSLTVSEIDPQITIITNDRVGRWNGTTLVDGTIVDNATNVGIGITPSRAKLEVSGFVANQPQSCFAFYARSGACNGSPATGASTGSTNYSIYASDRIMASEFNAFSDKRIKNNFNVSNPATDLVILNKLKVTNYNHIDTVNKGNDAKKGFIAQEVKEVFPEAVSQTTEFIPNIYQIAKSTNLNGTTLIVTLEKNHDLKIGDKVRLMAENQEDYLVISANQNTFEVANFNQSPASVFVFGKEVSDFNVVDYDRIFTLGISAIQELSKENQEQKLEIEKLKKQLEVSNFEILKRLEKLEKR